MVYLHFPSNLTEEELMLQTKYQKLKKKKKALQALKAPKPEPEKTPALKRPAEARDAREVAKKLLKSGAISAIPKPCEKTETTGFKRSRGLERKLSSSDRAPSGFQPFSASQGSMVTNEDHVIQEASRTKSKVPNLYENFISSRETDPEASVTSPTTLKETSGSPTLSPLKHQKPTVGHTVYVFGYSITEDILKKAFQSFGNVVNISMEIEKNCGFVTFDKTSSADRAISEMNGSMVSGIQLKVSLARRQPVIEPINDASSSATWSTIAARNSQKGSYKDKRDLVTYEEELF
ncbi:negative elongation factor E-like [Daphnia carinata]|uniref:negative elongation factor E-like n=1 Tax=Daphnia carinata TaxID=120202 RepID=UPI00257DA796|nr:negative elongation factor E-like [Daphnia carinata]XP_059353103.1 negative elongation factor E-like [Daphnia carinata]